MSAVFDRPERFRDRFQRLLPRAQAAEVIAAIGRDLDREATLGDVVDALEALDWGEACGDLTLADLADALLEEHAAPRDRSARELAAIAGRPHELADERPLGVPRAHVLVPPSFGSFDEHGARSERWRRGRDGDDSELSQRRRRYLREDEDELDDRRRAPLGDDDRRRAAVGEEEGEEDKRLSWREREREAELAPPPPETEEERAAKEAARAALLEEAVRRAAEIRAQEQALGLEGVVRPRLRASAGGGRRLAEPAGGGVARAEGETAATRVGAMPRGLGSTADVADAAPRSAGPGDSASAPETDPAPAAARRSPIAKRTRAVAAAPAEPEPEADDDEDGDDEATTTVAPRARPVRATKIKPPSKKALATLAEERLTLDQAAAVLVPLVASAGEMTMQELEDVTAVARRKLRFHVGQLVKQGYLERRGMGRGTTYAAPDASE